MRKETLQTVIRYGEVFGRLWIIALLVFALGYTPIHLILEPHGNGHLELAKHEHDSGSHHHHEGDHADHEDKHHAHHHTSEHATSALTPSKVKLNAFVFCAIAVIVDTFSSEPEASEAEFLAEAEIPPEASPPSPRQPRAPPIA